MGYEVLYTNEDGDTYSANNHEQGGSYIQASDPRTEMGVTSNYSRVYRKHKFHLTDLHGLTGQESMWRMRRIVKDLGTETSDNPWEPTNGNAGHVLSILLGWAKENPQGFFTVY